MITLKPIKESTEDYEEVELKLIELFRKEIYLPLLKELNIGKTIKNAKWDVSGKSLLEAIRSGRITFNRGTFSGRFNAQVSKELKLLGAKWDRQQGTFKIPQSELPMDIRNVISASESKFLEKIAGIDEKLAKLVPAEIADKVKIEKIFDRTIYKTNKSFEESVKGITIVPELTSDQRKKIASEWQDNMKIWVRDFTEKEITSLRKDVQKSVFQSDRYESMFDQIQKSYDVSRNKAKFLARQETSLLMTKLKETRYQDAGVNEYKWGCVAGSKNHPVRTWHKALEGKIFTWNNPPITTKPGEPVRRNNPGQDYNCRCFAIPVVRFNK